MLQFYYYYYFFKLKVEFCNNIFTAEDNLKVRFGSKGSLQDTAVCDKDLKIYPAFQHSSIPVLSDGITELGKMSA